MQIKTRVRVEEAINFRKELKDLEVSEKIRVESLIVEKADNQRKELQKKQVILFFSLLFHFGISG